jgi:hypothetical protein
MAQTPAASYLPKFQQSGASTTSASPSAAAAQQQPVAVGGATLNNKLVPYDQAMTALQQRAAAMPKAIDIETILPTKNSPLFKGGPPNEKDTCHDRFGILVDCLESRAGEGRGAGKLSSRRAP